VYVLPWICAPLVLGVVWRWILAPTDGALNALLGRRIEWLADPALALPSVAAVTVWTQVGYVALFFVAFGVICLIVWRTYRGSRISRHFGTDNILGAVLGAVWGVLLLIELLTIMRFYAVVPWREQEATQAGVLRQVQLSQVAPVLEVVAAPLWEIMTPWFPTPVSPRL